MQIEYIKLDEVASTNTYVAAHAASLPHLAVVYTPCQTAGRGQKGNSWESEPGKNLSFTMLLKQPLLPVRRQFALSEAVSVAVCDMLAGHLQEHGLRQADEQVSIKWPNDIYVGSRKIAGLLIEHSLVDGGIGHTIVGIGININQERFVSDAPNPVSLKQLCGTDHDLDELLREVCERIARYVAPIAYDPHPVDAAFEELHRSFLDDLYRNDGQLHHWQLPGGAVFKAAIADVEPDGMLVLRHEADGALRRYAFKEVKHVIKDLVL